MKKIILSILILILLTGCSGLYNLDNFILPDDSEFLALIEELNNPEKICQYMKDNFTYELHILDPLTPYQLYILRKGDCDDFYNWAAFLANYHGYEVYQVMIYQKNTIIKHCIAIYKEDGKYNFSDNQYYIFIEATNFKEIVEYDKYLTGKDWIKYIVYDYWNDIVEEISNN